MKPRFPKFIAIVIFSFVLFSCSNDDNGIYFEEPILKVNPENVEHSEIELEILDLVNNHRAELGLKTLQPLKIVSGVADGHTNYMVENGKVSHDNFAQRSQELMNNADAKIVGENVAFGFSSAKGVFNGWLNSDGHRKIIEKPEYTHFGISTMCNNEGRNFFTQIFIQK